MKLSSDQVAGCYAEILEFLSYRIRLLFVSHVEKTGRNVGILHRYLGRLLSRDRIRDCENLGMEFLGQDEHAPHPTFNTMTAQHEPNPNSPFLSAASPLLDATYSTPTLIGDPFPSPPPGKRGSRLRSSNCPIVLLSLPISAPLVRNRIVMVGKCKQEGPLITNNTRGVANRFIMSQSATLFPCSEEGHAEQRGGKERKKEVGMQA